MTPCWRPPSATPPAASPSTPSTGPAPSRAGPAWPAPVPAGPACDRPAKHPLLRHGVKEATTDPDRIGRWWRRWPQANLGLATGIVFDALDIDGPAGLAALRQLAGAAGLRLPGPLVATGGGGWHHWFTPTGLGNRPPRGLAHVDWRGRGGCVLAPPSRHISGRSPTAGCSASTRRRCPRSRPPSAPCSTPTRQPRPGQPTRPGRPHPATRTAARSWPPSWPPSAGPPRPAQPHPQPHRLQGLPLRRQRRPRRPGRHPCLHHRRPRHRPQCGRDRPHPGLGPHRRPGQPPHRPGRTRRQHRGGRP